MNYVIFDLEASCGPEIPNGQSEIIEIGAVKLNDKLEIIGEFQAFVKPILHPTITYFCEELTTITQADVDNADTFDKVSMDFYNWCKDYEVRNGKPTITPFVLCSWGFYDKKMLKSDCQLHGLLDDWVDNHISIKHQHGQMLYNEEVARLKTHDLMPTTRTKQLSKGIGMANALEMLGIKLDGTHHRGIDDARNIAKIFALIFRQLEFKHSN